MNILLDIPITDVPIACELTEEQLTSRRQNELGDLFSKVIERQELTDGYAFCFPSRDEVARKLLDYTLAERQCCAFFQIELVFMPSKGPIWLRLRGGNGVKQFIEAELMG